MTTRQMRMTTVKQGTCSIKTHHAALLLVPTDETYLEDIRHADVYGVDTADEDADVRSLPECWEPAGTIDAAEYHRLADEEDAAHSWDA